MYYKELPKELLQFTKSIDYESLLKDKTGHDWCTIPITHFLTVEGIQWFTNKKIFLRPKANVFKIVKNYQGPIHAELTSGTEFAINIVINGYGEMQWINNIDATQYDSTVNGSTYTRFNDVRSFNIVEVWTGTAALVKVSAPHRVVSTDVDRYCVNIRTSSPKTFEEALELIYN